MLDVTWGGAFLAGLISFISPCVLPIVPPAHHQIVAFVQFTYHHRNVVRIILQITIHGYQNTAPCYVNAGRHCRCLAEVTPELDDTQGGIFACQGFGAAKGRVLAAIINEDNFIRSARVFCRLFYPLVQQLDGVFLVVQRRNDG